MTIPRGDSPTDIIVRLDASLAARGQDVTLRRYTAPSGNPRPKTDVGIRAFVRPVEDISVKELVGNITTPYFNVVLSPVGIASLLPLVRGDKIVIDGKERNIETPKHIKYSDVLVRIELLVAG